MVSTAGHGGRGSEDDDRRGRGERPSRRIGSNARRANVAQADKSSAGCDSEGGDEVDPDGSDDDEVGGLESCIAKELISFQTVVEEASDIDNEGRV